MKLILRKWKLSDIVEKIVFWLLCVIFIFFTQEIWFILQNRVKSLEYTERLTQTHANKRCWKSVTDIMNVFKNLRVSIRFDSVVQIRCDSFPRWYKQFF